MLDYHNEIYSILMTVCAKTFEKVKERMIKPHQMNKLTPFRSNLLEMDDILKKVNLIIYVCLLLQTLANICLC